MNSLSDRGEFGVKRAERFGRRRSVTLRGCEEIHGGPSCGGTTPSASLRLLHDGPASSRRRASQLASSRSQSGSPWISSQPLSEAKDLADFHALSTCRQMLRCAQHKL